MDTLVVHACSVTTAAWDCSFMNKDFVHRAVITVSVNGYNHDSKGTRFDYGKQTTDAGKDITETPLENLSATFTIEVSRYDIAAIVIPKAH